MVQRVGRREGRLWPPSGNTVVLLLGCAVISYLVLTQLYVGHSSGGADLDSQRADQAALASMRQQQQAAMVNASMRLTIHGGGYPLDGPSCDDLLQVPKVALLFLTPGKLPHERLWREWMEGAAGMLPLPSVMAYAAGSLGLRPEKLREVQAACLPAVADRSRPVYDRQFLFTVYVHTHPQFRGYRNFSMFLGHEIPNRIVALRGEHSLTVAERLLLAESLKQPLNQMFLLLSESTVPIYPAPVLWEQFLAENLSRMDACNYRTELPGNLERWNDKMETEHFKKSTWRKTSQWFSALRRHAQVIADDVEVNEAFQNHCFPYVDHVNERKVSCSSNEHYTAIVLAIHGLGHETTCNHFGTTHVDWTHMNKEGRPRSFKKKEIRDRLIHSARNDLCTHDQTQRAVETASKRFIAASALPVSSLLPPRLAYPEYAPLFPNCSMFIRKFPPETSAAAREVLRKFVRMPSRQ